MKLKILLTLMAILIIGGLVWTQKDTILNKDSATASEFTGTLQGYENNILSVEGIYSLGIEASAVQEPRLVKIIITPETKITRTLLTLPSKAQLAKTGGRFEADKLPKVDSVVDLATLQKDTTGMGMGIQAKSNINIAGKNEFSATEINYRVVTQ